MLSFVAFWAAHFMEKPEPTRVCLIVWLVGLFSSHSEINLYGDVTNTAG